VLFTLPAGLFMCRRCQALLGFFAFAALVVCMLGGGGMLLCFFGVGLSFLYWFIGVAPVRAVSTFLCVPGGLPFDLKARLGKERQRRRRADIKRRAKRTTSKTNQKLRNPEKRKRQTSSARAHNTSAEIIADALEGAGRSAGLKTASPRRIFRRDTAQVPEVCADRRRHRCSP